MGPYRIAIATQGTRGDFQPALSLGLGLIKAGHDVKFFGNPDHIRMAAEFNLPGASISIEVKDLLASERGLRAMESGDLAKLGASQDFATDNKEDMEKDWIKIWMDEVTAFNPDLLIWTPLVTFQAMVFKDAFPEIPEVRAVYQPHAVPTNHLGPIGMQRVKLEPGQPVLTKWVLECTSSAQGEFEEVQLNARMGVKLNYFLTPQAKFELMFNVENWPSPTLFAYSPSWWPAFDDWPKEGFVITGNWKIEKSTQEDAAAKGGQLFNAGGQHQLCVDFINAGEKPVYLGWGSMMVYSKEHMARLAVGALKEAQKRGIIVGGWAELSEESLGGDEQADLKAYCKDNVLFLKSAPHEWLFPQCACCVHHGGIGTTQASLSAGVPTIVTPVFADQADIAKKLAADRHGDGTVHLSKVTAADLGARIRKVCDDPEIAKNCQDLKERMAKEDGVATTVSFLEKFMKEEVATGNYKQKQDALLQRIKKETDKSLKASDFGKVVAKWNMDVAEKYPVIKEYNANQVAQYFQMVALVEKQKLWVVRSTSGVLARKGEALKSEECGRFKEFCIVEEIEANKSGSRLRVRRLKGFGPEEGWVSPTVSGKDVIVKVANQSEIRSIQDEAMKKVFKDLMPKEDPDGKTEKPQIMKMLR
eukprot:gb/GFBE01003929.1/.p1 GENE.gb/GFBE01003929.1/~~gb/GFBE01003929.1/.p1  ORF type:complete len:645 (+),score=153.02 gb/GFBE01003929.1/:1-1935(+)